MGRSGDPAPEPLAEAVRDLARDMAINAFIDDIYSASYDLLLSAGMGPASALQALEEAVGRFSEPG
jgi:hypothetical protein